MKRIALSLLVLLSLSVVTAYAGDTAAQQEKDLEQKQRIYGIKYPWQNTAPYGTQYTPPQAGGEAAPDSSDEDKAKSDKPAAKTKAEKKAAVKKPAAKAHASTTAKTTRKGAAEAAKDSKTTAPAAKTPAKAHP